MRASIRRNLVIGLLALFIVGGLIAAFWPEPVPVDVARVERGELSVTIADEGETRVKNVYVVSAPIGGYLHRIEADAGDIVMADETVLAEIEPSDPTFLDFRARSRAEAAVKAAESAARFAEAEVARAQAELEFAEAELARAEALARGGNISQSTLDRAKLDVKTRRAAVKTAEAALAVKRFEVEDARAALIDPMDLSGVGRQSGTCCTKVYAPVSGRILRILRESEGVVLPGESLIEIGEPRSLEIVVDLLSSDAVRITAGAPVLISDWGGEGPIAGVVRRIEPYGFTKVSALGIEEQRVNVIVDFAEPPARWSALGHGYRVEVAIIVWQGEDVLKVPVGALFRVGDDWAVFRMEEGRARRTTVAIGHMNSVSAEVLSGLAAGDSVILHPSDRVADDVSVKVRP